jgi:O-antigen/teichoic acid export membrane protein
MPRGRLFGGTGQRFSWRDWTGTHILRRYRRWLVQLKEDRKANVHGSRYLVSVIGFSSVPRVITSVLTLVSFPLVVRAVGPADYGVFVYVTALVNVLVLFADLGVASASGKAIAQARLHGAAAARQELAKCARLQIAIGSIGLVPMLGVSWAIAGAATKVDIDFTFLLVMVLATWTSVIATFVRAALQSFLAFGWSAVLDSAESLTRSASWLFVAWFAPTYMGLGIATLVTSIVASALAIAVLVARTRAADDRAEPPTPPSTYRHLVGESAGFLGIGLATRAFLSIPFVIFGQLLLSSGVLGRLLVPESAEGPVFFGILSIVILTHSTSAFVATISDFVGGLRKRILFLSTLTLAEIPLLWLFARSWAETGAVIGYTLMQVLMIAGYIVIARKALFADERYRLPGYIARSFGAIVISLVAAAALQQSLVSERPTADFTFVLGLSAYAVLLAAVFIGFKELRQRFLSLSVFEFTRT